ncbi:MAG: hypothetical protein DRR08_29230 [Candidatus Parabeggiatoa sp. nov. 2]|nr:MAG: hypothetical protein DRR08_29230 [Gammaproteobacteria bacterium]
MTSINYQGDNITNLREYLQDEENISYQDFDDKILTVCSDIFQRCSREEVGKKVKGLIYGHIQSGKTAVILTTMALAADNGYKNFVVMTTNLNDIYDQTLDRIKSALDNFQVFGKKQLKEPFTIRQELPSVLVVPKHRPTLVRVLDRVHQLSWEHGSVMIIDDEADQASLDTNINDLDKPKSAINQAIVNLRDFFNSHDYLQTTATPQSLLLQEKKSAFKPDFVVTTIEGTGYVGGQYFFSDEENRSNHLCIVPDRDITRLTTSRQLPDSVKESILVFLLGAAILRLRGQKKKYTYLLHTSHKQVDHAIEKIAVDRFISELKPQFKAVTKKLPHQLRELLENAYTELQRSSVPSFQEVLTEVGKRIISTDILTINASSKEPFKPPTRKHTIYVGGTRLGRGVTIKNLLVTCYGRDALNPQMDTVLQHARMYGYRQNELAAIRIYLPQALAARFCDIHRIDNSMREMCQSEHKAIRAIALTENVRRLTRPNVLNRNTVNLHTYLGGRQYFPHLPISSPDELGNQTKELDEILSQYKPREIYDVTIDDILQILSFKFATPSYSDSWEDELISEALSFLKNMDEYGDRATLVIVNRKADIYKSESRDFREIAAILPQSTKIMFKVQPNCPALFMTRLNGKKLPDSPAQSWHDEPFWIPVVQFPKGHYAFTVNYS